MGILKYGGFTIEDYQCNRASRIYEDCKTYAREVKGLRTYLENNKEKLGEERVNVLLNEMEEELSKFNDTSFGFATTVYFTQPEKKVSESIFTDANIEENFRRNLGMLIQNMALLQGIIDYGNYLLMNYETIGLEIADFWKKLDAFIPTKWYGNIDKKDIFDFLTQENNKFVWKVLYLMNDTDFAMEFPTRTQMNDFEQEIRQLDFEINKFCENCSYANYKSFHSYWKLADYDYYSIIQLDLVREITTKYLSNLTPKRENAGVTHIVRTCDKILLQALEEVTNKNPNTECITKICRRYGINLDRFIVPNIEKQLQTLFESNVLKYQQLVCFNAGQWKFAKGITGKEVLNAYLEYKDIVLCEIGCGRQREMELYRQPSYDKNDIADNDNALVRDLLYDKPLPDLQYEYYDMEER